MLARLKMIFFLILIFLSYGEAPAEQYNQHTKNDQHGSFLTIDFQPINHTESTQNHKQNAEERLSGWLTDFRLTDLLIVIFTGVLAWKTGGLHKETAAMRAVMDEQRSDMLRSIKAAEDNAAAARAAADAAKLNAEALIDGERAHLYAVIKTSNIRETLRGPILFSNSPSMDDGIIEPRPKVIFVLKNLGRTPAIVKELSYQLIQGDPGQRTFTFAIEEAEDPVIDAESDSQSPITCSLENNLLIRDGRAVLDDSRPLYFYGYMIFSTSFGREYIYHWRYASDGARWTLAHYSEQQNK